MSKLDEEASVALKEFSLEVPARKRLRQGYNRAQRDGLTFICLDAPHDEFKENFGQLVTVKNAQEKSFSLGRFSDDYLQQFPLAIVQHGDRMVAFANVMQTASNQCETIDLMRLADDAPSGTMDFLFVSLMLHLKELGCHFLAGHSPVGRIGKISKETYVGSPGAGRCAIRQSILQF